MPYKNSENQKAAQARHYQKNKEVYSVRSRNKKAETRKWFEELKSTLSCEKCQENHPACLHFHHLDPSQKDLDVAQCIHSRSRERIIAEIAKCQVLCANCHMKLHWEEQRNN